MTREADDLTREFNLYWLQSELAALPPRGSRRDPMAALRTAARRAFLQVQAGGDKAPDYATLERLIILLMVDRMVRTADRRGVTMDQVRFRGELHSSSGQPDPFGLRFDVSRPGAMLDDAEDGPMQ